MRMFQALLVDDHRPIREGLAAMVGWAEHGYQLIGSADSGVSALEVLERSPCDLLITDIRMPDMDGMALIRTVRERKYPLEIIIISGYDDFAYAQAAMQYGVKHYMLKPLSAENVVETLLFVHADLVEREREKKRQLERLLYQLIATGRSDSDALAALEIGLPTPYYCVALLHTGQLDPMLDELFGPDEGNQSAQDLIMEFLLRYIPCHSARISEERIVLLFLPETDDIGVIKRIASELAAYIELYSGVGIQVMFDGIFSSMEAIPAAYERARRELDRAEFLGMQGIRVSSMAQQNPGPQRLMVDIKPLLDAVRALNRSLATAQITQLMEAIARQHAPLSMIQATMAEIVFRLTDMVMAQEDNITEAPDIAGYFDRLYCLTDLEAFKRCLLEISESAIACLAQCAKKDGRIDIMEIVHFIDANYADDLSIKRISQLFYMSPVYLGRLFTRNMGMKLNTYLNAVRIRNAQDMLKGTDDKIFNVCTQVGYKSLKYFYKIFKEETGMTPNEYRLIHDLR